MRTTIGLAATIAAVLACMPIDGAAPRFYPDDPVARNHDTQDASGMAFFEVDDDFEAMESLFANAGDPASNVRAVAINTDAEAPILASADYAVIGDLTEIVPALSAELRMAPAP